MNPFADAFANLPPTEGEDRAIAVMREADTLVQAGGQAAEVVNVGDTPLALTHAAPVTSVEQRHEEWHVTVKGDHRDWAVFCELNGLKPLFIELADNGHTLQLMSASRFDPRALINELMDANERPVFTIVRVKHEVSALVGDEKALYYEAHAKFNGPWRTDRKGVSRDLYRAHEGRWYMSKRMREPFDAVAFGARATSMAKPSTFAEVEYEACILDTNPALDGGWL